jgi:CRP-like cAMP-binding protein
MNHWAEVLAEFPLFRGVKRRRLRKLARGAKLAEFARGETILFPGDRGNALYVILGGVARTTGPTGRVLRIGDYFAVSPNVDGRRRSSRVIASSDVHIMELSSRSVLELARKHPAITLTMLENVVAQFRLLETRRASVA